MNVVAMLIDAMDITRLMVFAQQIEESKLEEESREKKRSKVDDDESDGHGRPRFRQKFPGQGLSSTPKFNQKRVSNPKSHKDISEILLSGCSKCDNKVRG